MSSKKYDLHCDGTSRAREKFVGQQVTLEDRSTLSIGFQIVAREDAQSLLQLSVMMLEELADLHATGEADATEQDQADLKQLFQNMVGIMTDRAATMKLFH